jgi:hypothetical protein
MGEILTQEKQVELLSDEVQSEADIDLRVEIAEMRVVDRYRRDREGSLDWYYAGELDPTATVRLVGYREDEDNVFDAQASDEDLTRRLRIVIAKVVEWTHQREDIEHIQREMKGQSSVSYTDLPQLPARLFRLLDPYDESEPVSGIW